MIKKSVVNDIEFVTSFYKLENNKITPDCNQMVDRQKYFSEAIAYEMCIMRTQPQFISGKILILDKATKNILSTIILHKTSGKEQFVAEYYKGCLPDTDFFDLQDVGNEFIKKFIEVPINF